MGDIYDETVALVESLGDLTPHGKQLAAECKALAADADHPFVDKDGKQSSRSATIGQLAARTAELVEKGRIRVDDESESDWASAAAGAGATPIRHTA